MTSTDENLNGNRRLIIELTIELTVELAFAFEFAATQSRL